MKTSNLYWRLVEQFSLWLVVTGTSWLLLTGVTVGLLRLLPLPPVVLLALFGLGVGALLGLAQWHFLLPDDVRLDAWLALSAAVGWLVLLIGALVLGYRDDALWLVLVALIGGMVNGAAQAYLLHLNSLPAWRWLLLTVTGWTAAGALGAWLMPVMPLPPLALAERYMVTLAIGALILSFVAAAAVVTLFPRRDLRDRSVRMANWY